MTAPTVEDVIADVLVGASMALLSTPGTQDDVIDWIETKAAAAVVAAVRAMTVEQQAQLIGGYGEALIVGGPPWPMDVAGARQWAALLRTRVGDSRVVGPWRAEP